jgi:hypothetical protein
VEVFLPASTRGRHRINAHRTHTSIHASSGIRTHDLSVYTGNVADFSSMTLSSQGVTWPRVCFTQGLIFVQREAELPVSVTERSEALVFNFFFVRVPPDIISLQLCTPKVIVV